MAEPEGVETLLIDAYRLLTLRDLAGASGCLDRALAVDYEDAELLHAMKCAAWWKDSMERIDARKEPFEAGELALERWKAFTVFAARLGGDFPRSIQAFRCFAFGVALSHYEALAADGEPSDPELLRRLGCARKGVGDHERAVRYLEAAAKHRKDDASVLAELADAYDLLGEQRASKALFREAFFLNPQKVELELIESASMAKLVARTVELGRTGHETAEWIPVYGELAGVFSVKRELKAIEAGKLKQSIYELETELAADGSRRAILVPRLINRYFWIVDHYLARREDKARVDEILLKIKLLDANVYKQYIA